MKKDTHLHTTFSDGMDTVPQLINNVKKAGVGYFSITDHDTAESGRQIFASPELIELIKNLGLTYVTGVEFTCTYKGHKMHILAYDFDPNAPEILELEQEFKRLLAQRATEKIELLAELGYILSEKSLNELSTKINIRTLDLANCLIDDGYFDDLSTAAKFVSKELKVSTKARLDANYVISKLSAIGAKMVWAHPIYGVGDKPRTLDEVRELAGELKNFGLNGLECYYSLYDEEEINELIKIASSLELFVTSGSDYHGKNKPVHIAEYSRDGTAVNFNNVKVDKIFNKYVISFDEKADLKGNNYEC